jgi:hypothetical protein
MFIDFEYLSLSISLLSSVFSAIFIAYIAIYLKHWKRNQVLNATIPLLAQYSDKIIFPSAAIARISPSQFIDPAIDTEYRYVTEAAAKKELLSFLNSMEYVATLINSRVIDEQLAREFLEGAVSKSFLELQVYIMAAREAAKRHKLFNNFEELARRWKAPS